MPARTIPLPDSVSPEAQLALSVNAAETDDYPASGDLAAWRAWVAERDEQITPLLEAAVDQTAATTEERIVDGVPITVVVPAGAEADRRVVLDLHGGALILLGGRASAAMARLASQRTRMVTWAPDYRMPPDHPFPAALDDCVAAYRHLIDQVGASQVVVSGTSAGGNLAAATMLRAKEEQLELPAALVLHTPEVDLTESGDTFSTNLGIDNVLRPLRPVNELYAAGADLRHPHLSPLFGDLAGFPPTLLTSGTRDLFLSNTVRMHRALRRASVEAELHVLEAGPHGGFMGLAPEDHELDAETRSFIDRHCPPH